MNTRNEVPVRKTGDLAKGRVSLPSARYFVTCRGEGGQVSLHLPPFDKDICDAIGMLERDGDVEMLCSTIMPDHVHFLFTLGTRITVSQVVGKFKAFSRRIAVMAGSIRWQRNFFEHRLNADEPANCYARYIFMNPYRAGLVGHRIVWPYWRCRGKANFDFQAMLDEGCLPPKEWFVEESDEFLLPHEIRERH